MILMKNGYKRVCESLGPVRLQGFPLMMSRHFNPRLLCLESIYTEAKLGFSIDRGGRFAIVCVLLNEYYFR